MNKDKKTIMLTAVGIVVLLITVIGATYAYFRAQMAPGADTNINVSSNSTDSLVFEKDGDLVLRATLQNFYESAGNLIGSTKVRARLQANDSNYTASYKYNVYVNIVSNDFEYKNADTSELLLVIKKPDTTYVTQLGGYNSETITVNESDEATGFDITTEKGLITVAEDVDISVSGAPGLKVDEWEVYVVFKNLADDQNYNGGKTFVAQVIIQTEKIDNLSDTLIASAETDNHLILHNNVNTISLLKADDIGAGDNSYRYSGSYDEVNNFICFGPGSESYNNGKTQICPDTNKYRVIGLFPTEYGDYRTKVIKNDYLTATELEVEAQGEAYHDAYENVQYHGSQIDIHGFHWSNEDYKNDWDKSALKNELNGEEKGYLHYLGDWANKIDDTVWHVQGIKINEVFSETDDFTAKDYYQRELGNLIDETELETYPDVTAKIGLMYISEYGYAASQEYWSQNLSKEYEYPANPNWMYNGTNEWMISRVGLNTNDVYRLSFNGSVSYDSLRDRNGLSSNGVRPTFNLKTSVVMVEDEKTDGSNDHPYRIAV